MMYYTGIDIGSTASKVVVLDSEKMVANFVIPTGWNSKDTSREIYSDPLGRYAGALGAAIIARDGKQIV